MTSGTQGSPKKGGTSGIPGRCCWLGLISPPVTDCAVDRPCPAGFIEGTSLHDSRGKARSQVGGREGRSAKWTAGGRTVARKAEGLVTWGRPREWGAGGGDGISPKLWNPPRPATAALSAQVIRGVRLELSSQARSPSGDRFLFRPPEKNQAMRGRTSP